jgi:hypothetical protein
MAKNSVRRFPRLQAQWNQSEHCVYPGASCKRSRYLESLSNPDRTSKLPSVLLHEFAILRLPEFAATKQGFFSRVFSLLELAFPATLTLARRFRLSAASCKSSHAYLSRASIRSD